MQPYLCCPQGFSCITCSVLFTSRALLALLLQQGIVGWPRQVHPTHLQAVAGSPRSASHIPPRDCQPRRSIYLRVGGGEARVSSATSRQGLVGPAEAWLSPSDPVAPVTFRGVDITSSLHGTTTSIGASGAPSPLAPAPLALAPAPPWRQHRRHWRQMAPRCCGGEAP